MDEIYERIADDISNQMILFHKQQKCCNKSFVQVYQALIKKSYKEYISQQFSIMSYIPGVLAAKGYDILQQSTFGLKKY